MMTITPLTEDHLDVGPSERDHSVRHRNKTMLLNQNSEVSTQANKYYMPQIPNNAAAQAMHQTDIGFAQNRRFKLRHVSLPRNLRRSPKRGSSSPQRLINGSTSRSPRRKKRGSVQQQKALEKYLAEQSRLSENQEAYATMPAQYSERAMRNPSEVLNENLQLLEQPPALSERELKFAFNKPQRSSALST